MKEKKEQLDISESWLDPMGYEYVKQPITSIRVNRVSGMWLVEYRRKPKWFFDKWYWFNDGQYTDFSDARDRALMLQERGYVLKTRFCKVYLEVNNG